ncbi:MAG: transcription termination factor Rho [Bacteroidaceae bacterium]|nr:transcription termination factor Rho [Bacteroidaceae bacterium]
MQQYNKEQLTGKTLDELHEIADEYKINSNGLGERDLVYEILEEQAKAAAEKTTSQSTASRKRTRIQKVDRVYTANQEKAKKVDKTVMRSVDSSLFGSLSDEEKALMSQAQESEKAAAAQESNEEKTEETVAEAPKKRGRKPGQKSKKTLEKEAELASKSDVQEAQLNFIEEDNNKDNNEAESDFIIQEMSSMDGTASASSTANGMVNASNVQPERIEPGADAENYQENDMNNKIGNTSDMLQNYDDEESDFIILEDIPAEEVVTGRSPMEFFKNYNNLNPIVNTTRTEAPVTPVVEVPKQKAYDFSNIITITGVLEIIDNYGFLRSSDYNYLASPDDVYVNQAQVKHYGLKTGDVIEGTVRPPKDGEKFFVLVNILKINGCDPSVVRDRVSFEFLTPLFPNEKFKLCRGDGKDSQSSRIVDLFSPIGKGQRALIVAQPKTGKTLLMKDIANSIARNHPEAYLIMLLIDERPEEVTDMARTVNAEVIASTFDAPAENHVKIAGLVLEKAKRMVECGHDVVIFLDSITRLARAYNTVSPASGKVLSGGVDANALQKPKRFFGAARNIEGGGSLTIVATALIDTGSKMDEVIFEEFKGTGNMELQLDRTLSNKRVFPAVNLIASSTRRDELLQDQTTLNRMWILRKHISDMTSMEAMDLMKRYMDNTISNEELLLSMNG